MTPPPADEDALDRLAPGTVARIVSLDAEAGPIANRLLDLGFVPNTSVRVLRRAPLGDPIAFEIRGSRICLRRSEARAVRVTTEAVAEEPR